MDTGRYTGGYRRYREIHRGRLRNTRYSGLQVDTQGDTGDTQGETEEY